MSDVAGVNPAEYTVLSAFKAAVYGETGPGTWLDDAKLEIIWREAHEKPIPDHLEPLLTNNA